MNHSARYGKFTSSEIASLLSLDKSGLKFGKPALTYIRSRGMERRLGRSISNESHARETTWGLLAETYVFGLLGLDYTLTSQETITHPKYSFWAGSPDGERFISEKTVFDCKAPFTLLSFCTLIDSFHADGIKGVRDNHPMGEKYYWQCVSNAILTNSTHAELIVFCPYQMELAEIRLLADNCPTEQSALFHWLNYTYDEELPYLIEGGHYKNLNVLRFPIPQEDKHMLELAVVDAEKILSPSILLAQDDQDMAMVEGHS